MVGGPRARRAQRIRDRREPHAGGAARDAADALALTRRWRTVWSRVLRPKPRRRPERWMKRASSAATFQALRASHGVGLRDAGLPARQSRLAAPTRASARSRRSPRNGRVLEGRGLCFPNRPPARVITRSRSCPWPARRRTRPRRGRSRPHRCRRRSSRSRCRSSRRRPWRPPPGSRRNRARHRHPRHPGTRPRPPAATRRPRR